MTSLLQSMHTKPLLLPAGASSTMNVYHILVGYHIFYPNLKSFA
jgi:hypothetical protein